MSHCPSDDQLRSFLQEELGAALLADVARHVDRCRECQVKLEQSLSTSEANSPLRRYVGSESCGVGDLNGRYGGSVELPLGSNGGDTPRNGDTTRLMEAARRVWQIGKPLLAAAPRPFDQFDDLQEIARGGMAIVYRARDLRLNRTVALKMLISGEYAGDRERARLHNEAQAIALLQHPNIVELFGVGETAGQPYLVLEFMAGGSLADRLKSGRWPACEAAKLVRVLAEAIQAAHHADIVHRDLKPANVLFTADGTPKIADFGIAKRQQEELTRTGDVLGSIDYMAPEQAQGRRAGPAADVYALGGILYALLTGHPPFQSLDSTDRLTQICHQDPPRPTREVNDLPRDLETICLKALEKEPYRRFETAAELAQELGRWLNNEPLKTRPRTMLDRLRRFTQRHRARVLGVAATILLVTGTVGYSQYRAAATAADLRYRAIVAAESKEEVQVRALLTQAHLQLENPNNGRVDAVRGTLIPEIVNRRQRISRQRETDDLDREICSLMVAAQSRADATLAHSVRLKSTPNLPWPAAAHPAGHAAVFGGPDRPYRVTRGEAFSLPEEVRNLYPTPHLWFSPSGKWVVFAPASGGLTLWNESEDRQLAKWPLENQPAPKVLSIGFARGELEADVGGLLLLGNDGAVRWLVGKELGSDDPRMGRLEEAPQRGYRVAELPGELQSGAFSGDAKQLAVGDDAGNIVVLGETGDAVHRIRVDQQPVETLAWSPNSQFLASGGNAGAVFVHDLERQELRHRLSVPEFVPERMFFAHDGRTLFVPQRGKGTLVWDMGSGELLLRIGSVLVGGSSDGLRFVGTGQEQIEFWDWHSPSLVVTCSAHRNTVTQTAWSADSQRFASIDNSFELGVWDRSGRLIRTMRLPSGDFFGDNGGLALDATGKVACYAYRRERQGLAYLLDVDSGELVGPVALPMTGFFRAAYHAETRRFVVACEDPEHPGKGDLRTMVCEIGRDGNFTAPWVLRPPREGEQMFLNHQLSGDGRYYVWVGPRRPDSAYRTELWDLGRKVQLEEIPDSDGNELGREASAQLGLGNRHLWTTADRRGSNVRASQTKADLTLHRVERIPVANSGDDKWLVHMGPPGVSFPQVVLQLYRFHDAQPLLDLYGERNVNNAHSGAIRFSPDGERLVWGTPSGKLFLLDLRNVESVLDEHSR